MILRDLKFRLEWKYWKCFGLNTWTTRYSGTYRSFNLKSVLLGLVSGLRIWKALQMKTLAEIVRDDPNVTLSDIDFVIELHNQRQGTESIWCYRMINFSKDYLLLALVFFAFMCLLSFVNDNRDCN